MEIFIRGASIKLGQLLKIINIIATGGEAKPFLMEHVVLINNRPAGGRNAQVRVNDSVVIHGQTYIVKMHK